MKENPQSPRAWGIAIISISILWLLEIILPSSAVDPWGIIYPKKIIHLVKTLALIQVIGMALIGFIGAKAGIVLSGFLGGLISSTMTTATLSQKSKTLTTEEDKVHSVAFLSAILAMLFQASVILITGLEHPTLKFLSILLGPIVMTGALIAIRFHRTSDTKVPSELPTPISFFSLIKLTLFILVVLSISSGLQRALGNSGLILTTSIAALFEMHGTVMVNMQLWENGHISNFLVMSLIAISFASTCISKMFLVYTLGSQYMRKKFMRWTGILLLVQFLNWLVLYFIS